MATASTPKRPPPSEEHRCSLCGKVFDSIETLNSHKKMDHGQESKQPAGVG
jgi:hypothetical protein